MARTNWKYKTFLFILFMLGYAVFYVLPNFRPVFPPMLLPRTPADFFFPLVPWTFLIYVSDYFFIFFTIAMLKDEAFHSFSRMMFASLVICGAFFLCFPTTYPRPPYPPADNAFVNWVMGLVGAGDTPLNCFPSMHVTLTAVSAWSLRQRGPGVVLFFLAWAIAIFVSTLTTKQHYFTDILGGLAVAFTVAVMERLFVETPLFKAMVAKAKQRVPSP